MSLPRPIRLNNFHTDLIWWDCPFKGAISLYSVIATILEPNKINSALWALLKTSFVTRDQESALRPPRNNNYQIALNGFTTILGLTTNIKHDAREYPYKNMCQLTPLLTLVKSLWTITLRNKIAGQWRDN